MAYIMLLYLRLVFYLISLFMKDLKKVFMGCFTMCYIMIYYTSVVLNIFDKMYYSMEFWIIESWSK